MAQTACGGIAMASIVCGLVVCLIFAYSGIMEARERKERQKYE